MNNSHHLHITPIVVYLISTGGVVVVVVVDVVGGGVVEGPGGGANGAVEEAVDLHDFLRPGDPDGLGDPPVILDQFCQLKTKIKMCKQHVSFGLLQWQN